MGLFGSSNNSTQRTADIKLSTIHQEGSEQLRAYVLGAIASDNSYEVDRVTKYHMYWKYYKGEHWRLYNHAFLSFNYARAFINKVISFLLGDKGFTIDMIDENGQELPDEVKKTVESLIEKNWRKNKKILKTYEILQMGSVCGDVWVLSEWDATNKYVKYTCLDSRYCFPEFKNGDITQLEAFTIRQALGKNDNGYLVYVKRFTKDKIISWYQKTTSLSASVGKFERSEEPNTYGFIPVVHIKNKPNASDYYSFSDLEDILKINKIYNEISQQIKRIVDYYSAPTTVVIGGTIKSMTKGIGRVWSGLPQGASVFNLPLGDDLGAAMMFLERLKQSMHELADVPENALGKLQAISNTSAAALKITYQPLIQQADVKSITYTEGFIEMHQQTIKMYQKFDKESLKGVAEDFADTATVFPIYTYGLPSDRMLDLQEADMELRARLNSRENVMNRLGLRNVPKVMDEIDEDLIREGAVDAQVQKMLMPDTGTSEPEPTA